MSTHPVSSEGGEAKVIGRDLHEKCPCQCRQVSDGELAYGGQGRCCGTTEATSQGVAVMGRGRAREAKGEQGAPGFVDMRAALSMGAPGLTPSSMVLAGQSALAAWWTAGASVEVGQGWGGSRRWERPGLLRVVCMPVGYE